MRILLWHGYLLSGSGSNLYTSNLARIWKRQGHDVLLMCQEQHPELFEYLDDVGDFSAGNQSWSLENRERVERGGRCSLVRPAIGDVLPVYVYDAYENFKAKRFVDLDTDELEAYTDRNVAALETAIDFFSPDAIITGHEVMGPHIALRACKRSGSSYVAKLHGSALEYAVKPQARYRELARSGLSGARIVTGGSRYMIEEAASVIPGWRDRAVIVNPGCDIDLFKPGERASDTLPTVGFVGKLIPSKGVHHLLAALPQTSVDLRAVIVGYGGFAALLQELWESLHAGDDQRVRSIATTGDAKPLGDLLSWLDGGGMAGRYKQRSKAVEVGFTGRMEHGPLSLVLPTFDVLVVPSVVPEAFGMVAAEAAACAVLPIVPRHSGIGEVGATLETELGVPGLLTYDPADPIHGISRALERVLGLDPKRRQTLSAMASETARRLWSWERVAHRLLGFATGLEPDSELD